MTLLSIRPQCTDGIWRLFVFFFLLLGIFVKKIAGNWCGGTICENNSNRRSRCIISGPICIVYLSINDQCIIRLLSVIGQILALNRSKTAHGIDEFIREMFLFARNYGLE